MEALRHKTFKNPRFSGADSPELRLNNLFDQRNEKVSKARKNRDG
jgi:hypothetical protein